MGMSSDYAAAIREGSTMVRIGTAIFWGAGLQKINLFLKFKLSGIKPNGGGGCTTYS